MILDGEYGEILGVHMFCKNSPDMIAEIVVAMTMEASAQEILEVIHPHPSISEAIPEAFMSAWYGRSIHAR